MANKKKKKRKLDSIKHLCRRILESLSNPNLRKIDFWKRLENILNCTSEGIKAVKSIYEISQDDKDKKSEKLQKETVEKSEECKCMCDQKECGCHNNDRFPYELLVQIYNQRIQILWFTIAFSLAFLGAFYISFTDPYYGDKGIIPLVVMIIGFVITVILFLFECRNYEILKHVQGVLTRRNRDLNEDLYSEILHGAEDTISYSKLINAIFAVLYFTEGMALLFAAVCFLGLGVCVTMVIFTLVLLLLVAFIVNYLHLIPSKVIDYSGDGDSTFSNKTSRKGNNKLYGSRASIFIFMTFFLFMGGVTSGPFD
jgi:hypothetical protein